MNYRRLGRSGLKVSELSFGSWITYGNQLGGDTARECMAAAYAAGVNFFDNAEVYAKGEAERLMGEALRRLGWRRASYIVSTKFYWGLTDGPNPNVSTVITGASRVSQVQENMRALDVVERLDGDAMSRINVALAGR